MNKCHFIGNLTRDPEVKVTAGGLSICKFSIAVNRRYKKDGEQMDEVAFLDFEAFGKQAEVIGEYFEKGKLITVHARVKQDTWEDKETGAKRSKLLFTVEDFSFVPGSKRDDAEAPTDEAPAKKPAAKKPAAKKPAADEAPASGNDDEVPF